MRRINPRSWDSALDAVQREIFGAAGGAISEDGDRILTAVFMRCEALKAKTFLAFVPTNAELAAKYAISERTVRNWRGEGCPFEEGQWRVLDWLAQRRYAPARAKARFEKQLEERKRKASWADFLAPVRQLKARYQEAGLKPPEWVRGICALGVNYRNESVFLHAKKPAKS
jgi:hypothetical protein